MYLEISKNQMKPQKMKNKALELYISNVPIYRIANQLKIDKKTVYTWKDKGRWDELKSEVLTKQGKKSTEKIILGQTKIVQDAQTQLQDKLNRQDEIAKEIEELWSQIRALDPKEDKEERIELFSMLNPLIQQLFQVKDLIAVMKHGLEVVRPKQTTNNLNLTKNESMAIQINIPESVRELLKLETSEKSFASKGEDHGN